jgi:hypothetical protein
VTDPSRISRLGALGPFFAVDFHTSGALPDQPWQQLTGLLQPTGVRTRIAQVRRALATTGRRDPDEVPRRVAASVAHLGLVARLISPQLGALIAGLGGLSLDPAQTWWQPVMGGPMPLSLVDGALDGGSPDAGLAVEGVVRNVTELFEAESVSPRVLWGNVASAIGGAYNAIVSVRPELTGAAKLHTLDALDHPLLQGASNNRPGPGFRRGSCCLIYLLASPATNREARQVCGDCVLRRPTATAG